MKIVKNACFGGFGLSLKAQKEYLKRKGKEMFVYKQTKYSYSDKETEYVKVDIDSNRGVFVNVLTIDIGDKVNKLTYKDDEYFNDSDIPRDDADLIAVIEEMGVEEASDQFARLEIVEIPDGTEWEIDEYDGSETIREKHRSW